MDRDPVPRTWRQVPRMTGGHTTRAFYLTTQPSLQHRQSTMSSVSGSSLDKSSYAAPEVVKEYVPVKNPHYEPKPTFTRVEYLQYHWKRKKQIAEAHPEVREFAKPEPFSFVYIILCVGIMTSAAWYLRAAPWWQVAIAIYTVGAITNHALWVLVHDATHDCMFSSKTMNLISLCLCNLPHIFPSAVSFRHYHRVHHSHLNEAFADPDVPGEKEMKFFSQSPITKMMWLFCFPAVQIFRTTRYSQNIFGFWMALNYVLNLSYAALIFHYMGPQAFTFLILSSIFSIGFHPVGARWISEHFCVCPTQETYSYYGPLNKVSFNIGYHNEHHDFPDVPWSHLPDVRKTAPEFYETLFQHHSYLGVLKEFFFDPAFTLHSRIVRISKPSSTSGKSLLRANSS